MKKAKKTTKKKAPKKVAPKKKTMTQDELVDMLLEKNKSGFSEAPKERIMVYGDYQNPMWKKGITNAGKGEGCKVFVPKRFSNRLKNKVVECERVDENGETYYKYLP